MRYSIFPLFSVSQTRSSSCKTKILRARQDEEAGPLGYYCWCVSHPCVRTAVGCPANFRSIRDHHLPSETTISSNVIRYLHCTRVSSHLYLLSWQPLTWYLKGCPNDAHLLALLLYDSRS